MTKYEVTISRSNIYEAKNKKEAIREAYYEFRDAFNEYTLEEATYTEVHKVKMEK